MTEYVALGLDPDSYWRITPREVALRLAGAMKRAEREHEGRVWQSWHTAVIPMMKRTPKMADLLPKKKPRPQTGTEMANIARSWHNSMQRRA